MGVATAIAIAGLGMSAYQGIKGAQATAAANDAAENAANEAAKIAEADKFKSLQVPTLGLELAQQNAQARQAGNIQSLQDIGAAGVLGGLTSANLQAQQEDLQLAAQAQQAQYQRDMAQAQNAQQIEQGRMQREYAMNQAKLAGSQAAAAEGRQQVNAAIQGGLSSLSNAAMLKSYNDIYGGTSTTNKDGNFLGNIGYALGLGGKNATPVSTAMVNAKDAFAPVISSMATPSPQVKIPNTGGINQANYTTGVLAPPQQQNWWQQPNSPYQWMFGNLNNLGQ